MTLPTVALSSEFECPICACGTLIRSRRRGVTERLVSLLHYRPYRCDDCGHRFFTRERPIEWRIGARGSCHAA